MPNINETQRKYLRTRLEAAYQRKQKEIRKLPDNPFPDRESKLKRIQDELRRVGLEWEVTNSYCIHLPEEKAHELRLKASENAYDAKLKELRALYDSLMDKIMLGTDAQELAVALETLNNFK
jgi:hypothetical protein